jgi:hypothetical protein
MADQNRTYADFMERLSSQIVDGIERAHETQSKTIERVRDAVERFLPDLGGIQLPFAELFPSPKEVAQANFAFAERLLRAQKDYAMGLIESFTRPAKPAEKRAA